MGTKKLAFTGERMIPEYNRDTTVFYEHISRYFFAAQFVGGKTVLDVGCGSGYGSRILVDRGGAAEVKAVDVSSEAIEYAQKNYGDDHISFKVDNAETIKTVKDATVDVVVCFELIEHISNQASVIKNIKRALKPGGILAISTPNSRTYPKGNPYHKTELDQNSFLKLLGHSFKHIKCYYQKFEFSNTIKPDSNASDEISSTLPSSLRLISVPANSYTPPPSNDSAEYLIAVCSNEPLEIESVNVGADIINGLDMSTGFVSLGKQFSGVSNQLESLRDGQYELGSVLSEYNTLHEQIERLKDEINMLENNLQRIVSGRVFRTIRGLGRLWRLIVRGGKRHA